MVAMVGEGSQIFLIFLDHTRFTYQTPNPLSSFHGSSSRLYEGECNFEGMGPLYEGECMALVGEGSLVSSWAYTPLNLVANRPYTLCQTFPASCPHFWGRLWFFFQGLLWDLFGEIFEATLGLYTPLNLVANRPYTLC